MEPQTIHISLMNTKMNSIVVFFRCRSYWDEIDSQKQFRELVSLQEEPLCLDVKKLRGVRKSQLTEMTLIMILRFFCYTGSLVEIRSRFLRLLVYVKMYEQSKGEG